MVTTGHETNRLTWKQHANMRTGFAPSIHQRKICKQKVRSSPVRSRSRESESRPIRVPARGHQPYFSNHKLQSSQPRPTSGSMARWIRDLQRKQTIRATGHSRMIPLYRELHHTPEFGAKLREDAEPERTGAHLVLVDRFRLLDQCCQYRPTDQQHQRCYHT